MRIDESSKKDRLKSQHQDEAESSDKLIVMVNPATNVGEPSNTWNPKANSQSDL